jgi:hypothetical protein
LPGTARSFLIALAAGAGQIRVNDEDLLIERIPEEFLDRLYDIEAVEHIDSEDTKHETHWIVRRVGMTSVDELARLSGIHPALVYALLGSLGFSEEPLLILHLAEGLLWYHLPACWWTVIALRCRAGA